MQGNKENQVFMEMEALPSLYPDFKEAYDLIEGLYLARDRFLKKHLSHLTTTSLPSKEEVEESMKSSRSLHLKGELEVTYLFKLLQRMEEEMVEKNPKLREGFPIFLKALEEEVKSQEIPTCRDVFHSLETIVAHTPFEKDLVTFILTFSLSTMYQSMYSDFLSTVDTSLWDGGSCPVCATRPHYGKLELKDGAKILECWLCATSFHFPRIKCPFCGNEDQEKLGYFKRDDRETIARVDYCEICNSYYKIFDVRQYEREEANLALHNLATLSYDLMARGEGLLPGSGLEWVNEEELQTLER